MKRPNITPGQWAPIYNNFTSVLKGHTIKAQDEVRTPVAEAFVGRGASKKGILEQMANAQAIAALPDLLRASEELLAASDFDPSKPLTPEQNAGIANAQAAMQAALIKAGYTFES